MYIVAMLSTVTCHQHCVLRDGFIWLWVW